MPRAYDSDSDEHRNQGGQAQQLTFTENKDCPECDTIIEVVFTDDSISAQDMREPPADVEVTCTNPDCKHVFTAEFEGWSAYNEA